MEAEGMQPVQPNINAGHFDEDDDLMYARAQQPANYEEKVKYRGMVRAWLAALRFDSMRSYEAYRLHAQHKRPARIMLATFIITPILSALVMYPDRIRMGISSGNIPGDFLRIIGLTAFASVLTAFMLVLSIYAASHATAYVARRQFHSEVSGKEHFALSSLYAAPLFILGCVLMVLMVGIMGALPYYSYYGSYEDYSPFVRALAGTIPGSVAITMMIFTGYVIVQYIFSAVAIHRLRAMPGIVLTLLFMTVQLLVMSWTAPFLTGILAAVN